MRRFYEFPLLASVCPGSEENKVMWSPATEDSVPQRED